MRYKEVKGLKPEASKQLTGVKPQVFKEMLAILQVAEREKKKAGRRSKLTTADKLLLALSYWR